MHQNRLDLVIDDLANREHEADILLDQNLYPDMFERYKQKVNSECQIFLGLDYALMQPEYAKLCTHKFIPKNRGIDFLNSAYYLGARF